MTVHSQNHRDTRDPATGGRSGAWARAGAGVLRDGIAVVVFAVVVVLGLLVYRVWLPIPSVAFSIALSVAFGAVIALQVHTVRRTVRTHRRGTGRRGTLGGVAFVISCLPCVVGLTPAVPALLAAFGASAATTKAATSGTRHAFMGILPALLAASLALLVLVAGWSFSRLAATERGTAGTATTG